MKNDDMLVVLGGEIKALGNGKLGGYLVRFTDADTPDMENDFFTKDTDFDIERGDRVTVYYNHGLDPVLKKRKLSKGTVETDSVGVWIETQLAMRDEYEKAIYDMAESGKLGWSSGTLPNLIEREPVKKANWIKHWPLGSDASLTPTPAAGLQHTQVTTLKSVQHLAEADERFAALLPEDASTASEQEVANAEADAKRLLTELNLMELEV
ncbi:hypothetical protein LCGC14_0386770 [marine sediment metagenome]|uniref:HK97 family phage prohead protease n=1 Tax=marine sediment metagenome TaxID=412755 RepID=A0A0F9T6G9_9ZZZZ